MTIFRLYDPDELGRDGYPIAWGHGDPPIKDLVREHAGHRCIRCGHPYRVGVDGIMEAPPDDAQEIADELGVPVRALDLGLELAADRHNMLDNMAVEARRCHWSPCDTECTHAGPIRHRMIDGTWTYHGDDVGPYLFARNDIEVQALWRILTVHHLDGNKANCRWWNLVALCQRCHLHIQKKVQMPRIYPFEHTEWFRPYVAGYYAAVYEGHAQITRSEVEERMDELLAYERMA